VQRFTGIRVHFREPLFREPLTSEGIPQLGRRDSAIPDDLVVRGILPFLGAGADCEDAARRQAIGGIVLTTLIVIAAKSVLLGVGEAVLVAVALVGRGVDTILDWMGVLPAAQLLRQALSGCPALGVDGVG